MADQSRLEALLEKQRKLEADIEAEKGKEEANKVRLEDITPLRGLTLGERWICTNPDCEDGQKNNHSIRISLLPKD